MWLWLFSSQQRPDCAKGRRVPSVLIKASIQWDQQQRTTRCPISPGSDPLWTGAGPDGRSAAERCGCWCRGWCSWVSWSSLARLWPGRTLRKSGKEEAADALNTVLTGRGIIYCHVTPLSIIQTQHHPNAHAYWSFYSSSCKQTNKLSPRNFPPNHQFINIFLQTFPTSEYLCSRILLAAGALICAVTVTFDSLLV